MLRINVSEPVLGFGWLACPKQSERERVRECVLLSATVSHGAPINSAPCLEHFRAVPSGLAKRVL